MNTTLWILQALMAITFLYSGVNKSIFSEEKLVARGQTGVEGLAPPLIRFIGIIEILGSVGLILPWLLNTVPLLTPIAALGFAIIMIPAAVIHSRRHEPKNVLTNVVIFTVCIVIAVGRF